ncbi:MAG: GGDEF domain-containing protein [Burkholderiales bacterium]|nr:GGDEF domain-containing protein [Burkholderiales bacterium]
MKAEPVIPEKNPPNADELLLAERDRFRSLIEAMPDGLLVTDLEGSILNVNSVYCNLSGYSREELLLLSLSDLEAAETPEIISRRIEALSGHGRDRYESLHLHKDGSIWPAEVTIVLHLAMNELYIFVRDLTGIKILEAAKLRAEEKMRNLALHDAVTGLPNRRVLIDRLKHALAASRRNKLNSAIILIDLEHFRDINETLGSESGDFLLSQVAQRITGCIREEDSVARIDGDEFAVMLNGLSSDTDTSASQAGLVGRKILDALNDPYILGNKPLFSLPSVGITLFRGAEDADAILRRADLALNKARRAGRNAVLFYREMD